MTAFRSRSGCVAVVGSLAPPPGLEARPRATAPFAVAAPMAAVRVAAAKRMAPGGGGMAPAAVRAGLAGATLAIIGLLGCASRSETRRDTETQEYSTSVQILGNRAEALLVQGRAEVSAGKFEQAVPLFESALGSPAAKPEHKAQALLALAHAWGNPLNMKRDPEKARAYYQRVIAEYPDSPQRAEAERAVGAMRTPTGD